MLSQGLVKGAILCFRNGESTSPASQKSKDLNKVSLLLQDLEWNPAAQKSFEFKG